MKDAGVETPGDLEEMLGLLNIVVANLALD